MSLNNGYEESNTGDNQVVYNGNLVSYDSVPVADFNNPLKISLNMDFTHQPSGLVWANTLAWQEARKARIILVRRMRNTSANIQITSSMLTKNWIAA